MYSDFDSPTRSLNSGEDLIEDLMKSYTNVDILVPVDQIAHTDHFFETVSLSVVGIVHVVFRFVEADSDGV
jgi:hypothetical protein